MTKWKNPLVWLRGLVAAFVGGGAGAIASGFISVAQTPQQYNFNDGWKNLVVMIVGTFVLSGTVTAAAYLQKSPLPELEEVNTTIINKNDL